MLWPITQPRDYWYDKLAILFGHHLSGHYDREMASLILKWVHPSETHEQITIMMVGGEADYLENEVG